MMTTMDQEQLRTVAFRGRRGLLLGGAGSGKTTVLAQRAEELRAYDPDSPMSVLTLSVRKGGVYETLTDYSFRLLSSHGLLPLGVERLEISDILSVLSSLSGLQYRVEEIRAICDCACLELSKKLSLPEDLQVYRGANLRYRGLATAYLQHKAEHDLVDDDDLLMQMYAALRDGQIPRGHFCWVQVDDAQEATPLHLALLELIVSEKGGLLLAGDEAQSLASDLGRVSVLDLVEGVEVFRLSGQYRSTAEVSSMLSAYRGEPYESGGSVSEDNLPVVALLSGPEQQDDLVAALVRQSLSGRDGVSVGVLVRTHGDVLAVSSVLEAHGISDPNLVVSTVADLDRSEYDHVIVYNVSVGVYPYNPTSRAQDRRHLYVAMSRAKSRLYLVGVGQGSPFLEEMDPALFYRMGEPQIQKILKIESLFVRSGTVKAKS